MKTKILNAFIIITSLFSYMEWGEDNNSFLFEVEYEVFTKLFTNPLSVAHPLILIPLFGQFMLLITLFQQKPSKIMTYSGITCLGILLGLLVVIGIIATNFKILLSTIPFIATAGYAVWNIR